MLAKPIQSEGFTVRLVDTNFDNVRAGRMDGLDVYYGNVLSEYTEDHIELSGIDHGRSLSAAAWLDIVEPGGRSCPGRTGAGRRDWAIQRLGDARSRWADNRLISTPSPPW